jgi:hypothetical protein
MNIKTLIEQQDNGVYIGCHYVDDSVRLIDSLAKSIGIHDFKPDTMHTTIIYSGKPGGEHPGFEKTPITGSARIKGIEIFKSRQNTNVLVVTLDSPFLSSYHHTFMAEHNYTYDYDEYKPHITLTYAYASDEIPVISDEFMNKILTVSEIYYEPLNLNWVNK